MKTTSPHKVNLRAEKIRNSGAKLLCVLCWDFKVHAGTTKKRALCALFLKTTNHEPNKSYT